MALLIVAACPACMTGCDHKKQSDSGVADLKDKTPVTAESRPKTEKTRDAVHAVETWEEALAAAQSEGSDDAAERFAAWLVEKRAIGQLAALLGEDGEPVDEFSRRLFAAYAARLDAELASTRRATPTGPIAGSFESFAATDPWAAANVAFALGKSAPEAAAVLQSRAGWHAGKSNREKALSRVIAVTGRDKSAALSFGQGVLDEWMMTDTLSASEWLEQVAPLQPSLRELTGAVAAKLAAKSPLAAVEWLQRLPAPYGEVAAGPLAAGWAEVNPLAALEWSGNYSGGANGEVVLESAVISAAQAQPKTVLGWLEKNVRLEAATREELVRTVSGVWAQRDPRGAFRWLSEHTGEKAIVPAVEGSARALASKDPRLATEIALLAAHDPRGAETLRKTLETWRKYRMADFNSGIDSLAARLREEGDTRRADILVSAALKAGQD